MRQIKLTREERFVQKYLKKHGRLKVLKIFNEGLEGKQKKGKLKYLILGLLIWALDERKSSKFTFKAPKTPARKKSEEDATKKIRHFS